MAVHLIELCKKGYHMPIGLPNHLNHFMLDYDAQKMGSSSIEHKFPEYEENLSHIQNKNTNNNSDSYSESILNYSSDKIAISFSKVEQ